MNWAYVHLILNHVPVLGTIFGLALLAWALMRRNEPLQRTALATFIVVAVAALPVFFTGEPAEHMVEHLAGTAEPAIKAHEAAALAALIAVEILGVMSLGALLLFRGRVVARAVIAAELAVALATAGLMAQTANLGGKIRHEELRAAGMQMADEHRDRDARDRERH
jgi:uncharacterized membrane protein